MICIIAITVMGCSVFTTDHIDDDKQEPDLAGPEKVAVNDFQTIDSLLKRQEGVVLISWAQVGKYLSPKMVVTYKKTPASGVKVDQL